MDGFNKCFCKSYEKRKIKFIMPLTVMVLIVSILWLLLSYFLSCSCTYAASRSSAIVIDSRTGRILYENNKDERLPMASTTKIMTALIAIEKGNLDSCVKIPKEAVGIEGSSIYLKEGELLTLRELLYGLMLQSGNDASIAIAINVGGSVEEFVNLMNAKVAEMGLKNTHFENPNGLHNENHYTSSFDLAMITKYAYTKDDFREIVGTKNFKIPYEKFDNSETENKYRYLKNKNKILNEFEGGIGVKTGYTKDAGRCLVSAAKRGDSEIICVVLNHPDMFSDSKRYMENAFKEFPTRRLISKGDVAGQIKIAGSNREYHEITVQNDIMYPMSESEFKNVKYVYEYDKTLKAPLKSGDKVGKIKVYIKNQLISEENLVTINDVNEKELMDQFQNIA